MLFNAIRDIWTAFKQFTDQAIMFAMAAIVIYIAIAFISYITRLIQHKKPHSIWYVLFKTCLFALFGIYTSYLIALTLSGRQAGSREGVYNLAAFSTIDSNSLTVTILENVILFVPLGLLIPMVWKYFRGIFRTTIIGFFISVLIEVTQLLTKRGYFDIDDIILNTLGAFCGYVLFSGLYDGYLGIKRRIITDVARKLKITPPLGRLYDRMVLKSSILLFALQMFPIVVWANIIMGFSSDTGEESGVMSKSIVIKLLSVLSNGSKPSSVANAPVDSDVFLMIEKVIRKMAHCFIYGVFAILVWALLYSIRRLYKMVPYILGFVSAFCLGAIDEMNQSHTAGRTGIFRDVLVDSFGAFVALVIVLIIVSIVKKHYSDKFSSPRAS